MSLGGALGKIQKTITSGGLSLANLAPEAPGDSGANAREEEARKAALRRKIDAFYGIAPPASAGTPMLAGEGGSLSSLATVGPGEVDPALAQAAEEARVQLEGENTKLADATRSYYTDQLGKTFEKAERGTRFKLARQGLLGSSEDVAQQGQVTSDRDLGATRIDEAVRRAVAQLTGQREQERLSAVNLVNSGAGDSAVSAAQAGIRNSLANATNAQKQDIFSDLFANSADALASRNAADREAALLGRYRDRLTSFFPSSSTTSGRVTPSA